MNEQAEQESDGIEPVGRATYSPEDNKLRIYPDGVRIDSVLSDEEYSRFKSAGYKWAGKQECFVAPRWTPTAEDWALRLCGEIDDEDYSAIERSADRAERFGGYREKRADEAGAAADAFEAGPSAFGHQNRARAERQARRHDRYRVGAVSQWAKAEYWQARTEGVIAHALHRADPATRRGRIKKLETEQRRYAAGMGERWARHYELRLTYERAMLANEGGTAADAEMERGGWIGSHQIHKVNKSNTTGKVVSVTLKIAGDRWGNTKEGYHFRAFNIERMPEGAYRAPTDEERAAFVQATKERKAKEKAAKPPAPPLINPTDADAERLQAIWNAEGRAAKQSPQAVLRMTQAEYSARSKGSYSSFETIDISERAERIRPSLYGRSDDQCLSVCVFKIRRGPSSGLYAADRVIVLTDKPQKAIPWEAMDEARDALPSVETLIGELPAIAAISCKSWYGDLTADEVALFDKARYVGWAYYMSQSQFGLTEAGRAALKRVETAEPVPAGQLF